MAIINVHCQVCGSEMQANVSRIRKYVYHCFCANRFVLQVTRQAVSRNFSGDSDGRMALYGSVNGLAPWHLPSYCIHNYSLAENDAVILVARGACPAELRVESFAFCSL
jgi:hypothetical protein